MALILRRPGPVGTNGVTSPVIARSFVAAAEDRVGEHVLAAGSFRRSRPATGGRRDWISVSMRVLSVAMAGRDSDLPRRVVVAVTPDRVYVLRCSRVRVGAPVAEWGRAQLQASVDRSGRRCRVWVQPPGDRPGFELRGPGGPATDSVLAALGSRSS